MKYEWRKEDKSIYLPKDKPELIDLGQMKYLTIDGKGNPNTPQFAEVIEALYSLSYGVRMSHKSGKIPNGYYEYTVFPLEGIWDLAQEGRGKDYLDKDELVYTLMIRQPDFLDAELLNNIILEKSKKSENKLFKKIRYESLNEGLNVQMMHIGSYDDEPASFKIMEDYCKENGLERIDKTQKEIYISDFRKVEKEKLKTVLRFKVRRK